MRDNAGSRGDVGGEKLKGRISVISSLAVIVSLLLLYKQEIRASNSSRESANKNKRHGRGNNILESDI